MESRLIRKINMFCPLCEEMHELEERERTSVAVVKGYMVNYTERFYLCLNTDSNYNRFVSSEMMNESLDNAREAYELLEKW